MIFDVLRCIYISFILTLVGCTSSGTTDVRDASKIASIVPGESTKSDVYGLLGQPANVESEGDGRTSWVYFSTSDQLHWATLIPYAGYVTMGNKVNRVVVHIPFFNSVVSASPDVQEDNYYQNSWSALATSMRLEKNPSTDHIRSEMESLSRSFDKNAAEIGLQYLQFFEMRKGSAKQ